MATKKATPKVLPEINPRIVKLAGIGTKDISKLTEQQKQEVCAALLEHSRKSKS